MEFARPMARMSEQQHRTISHDKHPHDKYPECTQDRISLRDVMLSVENEAQTIYDNLCSFEESLVPIIIQEVENAYGDEKGGIRGAENTPELIQRARVLHDRLQFISQKICSLRDRVVV